MSPTPEAHVDACVVPKACSCVVCVPVHTCGRASWGVRRARRHPPLGKSPAPLCFDWVGLKCKPEHLGLELNFNWSGKLCLKCYRSNRKGWCPRSLPSPSVDPASVFPAGPEMGAEGKVGVS